MKFLIGLPGLMRYPPSDFPPGGANWQEHLGPADFQRVARTAEELGFDAISVPEHVALPSELVPNMGAYWPHAFTVMAFAAGATSRIRVTSSVIVLPYHHPVPLAKAVSTLDVLSGGRVTLCVGVGMAPAEFAAVGVRFEDRGRVTDEYVAVMKELWTAAEPCYEGAWVTVRDVTFEPKPVQQPHPPIWFGGRSMVSLRRAARSGSGWSPAGGKLGKGPWLEDPEQLPAFLEAAGVEQPFDVSMPPVEARIEEGHHVLPPTKALDSTQAVVDAIARLQELGVTWTFIPRPGPPPASLDDFVEALHWAAEEVMPAFGPPDPR